MSAQGATAGKLHAGDYCWYLMASGELRGDFLGGEDLAALHKTILLAAVFDEFYASKMCRKSCHRGHSDPAQRTEEHYTVQPLFLLSVSCRVSC